MRETNDCVIQIYSSATQPALSTSHPREYIWSEYSRLNPRNSESTELGIHASWNPRNLSTLQLWSCGCVAGNKNEINDQLTIFQVHLEIWKVAISKLDFWWVIFYPMAYNSQNIPSWINWLQNSRQSSLRFDMKTTRNLFQSNLTAWRRWQPVSFRKTYSYLYSVKKLCRHCKHVFPWQILEFWNSDFIFGFIDLGKYLFATKGYIFSWMRIVNDSPVGRHMLQVKWNSTSPLLAMNFWQKMPS